MMEEKENTWSLPKLTRVELRFNLRTECDVFIQEFCQLRDLIVNRNFNTSAYMWPKVFTYYRIRSSELFLDTKAWTLLLAVFKDNFWDTYRIL